MGNTAPTPAQTVALRFPADFNTASAQPAQPNRPVAVASALPISYPQLALFSPEPLVPHAAGQQSPVRVATAERTAPTPALDETPAPQPAAAVPAAAEVRPAAPVTAPKPRPAVAVHRASRPAYMLDDAQIAAIKRRLHLTPDQEQMWPAVAVALRNIGAAKAREAHHRGPSGVDPNSTEVADLKSAAIPLLMSFNSEQKDEVRSLVHVMGLDQLASQF
jgi:hypothetical protein